MERYSIKGMSEGCVTILFTRHRTDASTRHDTYTWNKGGVHVTVSEETSLPMLLVELRNAVRVTPHWDNNAEIHVEFLDCTNTECLCAAYGRDR